MNMRQLINIPIHQVSGVICNYVTSNNHKNIDKHKNVGPFILCNDKIKILDVFYFDFCKKIHFFASFFTFFFSGNHLEVNNAKQRNGYDHLTRDKFNQSRNEFTNFNQSCLNTPAAAYNYNQLNLNAHA